jgi:hypothetical protein
VKVKPFCYCLREYSENDWLLCRRWYASAHFSLAEMRAAGHAAPTSSSAESPCCVSDGPSRMRAVFTFYRWQRRQSRSRQLFRNDAMRAVVGLVIMLSSRPTLMTRAMTASLFASFVP